MWPIYIREKEKQQKKKNPSTLRWLLIGHI